MLFRSGGQSLAGRNADGGSDGFGPAQAGSGPARRRAAARASPVSPWSPLVIAVIAVLAAASALAPILGTAVGLVVLVALRAASITGRRMVRRRSGDGRRTGDPLVAAAFYPVAVLRSLISLLLLAPVAVLGFGVAAAITIIAVPVHPLPRAVALGAATLVAVVGLGPGSGGSRTTLAGFFGAIARTRSRLAIAYVGVLALAAWAGLTAYAQPAAYWPADSLHTQLLNLPTVHSMLSDVRLNLLMLARRFGL